MLLTIAKLFQVNHVLLLRYRMTLEDQLADYFLDFPMVVYQGAFVKITGSSLTTILLSQIWYWTTHMEPQRDGWMYFTQAAIKAQTGLSEEQQLTARKRLVNLGILEEVNAGIPKKLYIRINKPRVIELVKLATQQSPEKHEVMVQPAMIPEFIAILNKKSAENAKKGRM